MEDRAVSLTLVLAVVGWAAGFGLVVLRMITDAPTADLGLLLAGVGGIASVRLFMVQLWEREQVAFELGREHARLKACGPAD